MTFDEEGNKMVEGRMNAIAKISSVLNKEPLQQQTPVKVNREALIKKGVIRY